MDDDRPYSLRATERLILDLKARDQTAWRDRIDRRLDEILSSRESAIQALSDANCNVRSVALQLLLKNWKTSDDVAAKCFEMLRSDPDTEVRLRAMFYIGAVFRQTANRSAVRFLAHEMITHKDEKRIVEGVYYSLLRILGRPVAKELVANVFRNASNAIAIDFHFINGLTL